MKFGILISSSLLLLFFTHPTESQSQEPDDRKKVVCYFGSWSVYRPGNGKFDVENIDPYICTHLIFGFTGLSPTGTIVALDPYNDLVENWGRGAMKRFNDLRKVNSWLKTLVAIGGWNEGSEKYSQMAASPQKRQIFIESCVDFVLQHNFDGLDLDWEYPAHRGGIEEDKVNFASLLREMRAEFDKYGLLLTAAVSAGQLTIEGAYDVPTLARNLDFINVMAYDFHGAWESWAYHQTPMYAHPDEEGETAMLNVDHSIKFWMAQGAPPEKLILGMGAYGRGFTLDSEWENGLNASASQGIVAGPYTRESGFWGFLEICEKQLLQEPGQWTVYRPDFVEAPYMVKGRDWMGYDDIQSIKLKSEYILEMGLGGGMVWSIDTEDYIGNCYGESFPLIKTIHRTLNGQIIQPPPLPTTTEDPSNTRPTPPVTEAPPPPSEVCEKEGMNPDPTTPCSSKFYQCINNGGVWTVHEMNCASGTIFNPILSACTYPAEVPGCG